MTKAVPNLHYIPQGRPFAEDLARGILSLTKGDDHLADSTILLPNRRLTRAVREAFLSLSVSDAQLLPRMLPIGDVDDDDPELIIAGWNADDLPQVIDPVERQLLLSQLVEAFTKSQGREIEQIKNLSLGEIMSLAKALCHFLDQIETSGCDLSKLKDLAGGEHATHWSKILQFLDIVIKEWPKVLSERNRSDLAVWRNAAIRARAKAWQKSPPKGLVVIAGSTGSVPATQALMKTVMTLERGHIVLSGLDINMDIDDWQELDASEDESVVAHPQYPLKQLLEGLEVSRDQVSLWQGTEADLDGYNAESSGRVALLREVMRPPQQTNLWRRIPESGMITSDSVKDFHLVKCYDRHQESDVIALAMREALEIPERTAVLITADTKLGEMVSDNLKRWNIEVAPSAGKRLSDISAAQFMRLILDAWLDDFSPVSLLAMAHHQLAAGGMKKVNFRKHIRALELTVLRAHDRKQSYQKGGLNILKEIANSHDRGLGKFVQDHLIKPLERLQKISKDKKITLANMVEIHCLVTQAMAETDQPIDSLSPWRGIEGHKLSQFLHKLSLYGQEITLEAESYQSALMSLMSSEILYPYEIGHPRLAILGTIEARMHTADLTILGGMIEGVSPLNPPADPWMNQKMRLELGLPHAHWRAGLAAQDAVIAMARPEVLITHAERDEGSPVAPSRWIQRLNAVSKVAKIDIPTRDDLHYYAKTLYQFDSQTKPIERPNPTPPIESRPNWFSATQLDTLLKDPYAIYARHILKLKALPKLKAPLGAADRGTLIHDIFYNFIKKYPSGDLPNDALSQLMAIGKKAFEEFEDDLIVKTFWWQRFRHMAIWFINYESGLRRNLEKSYAEIKGETTISTSMGDITITAKADRIDIMKDGRVRIIDYKTGAPPSKSSVKGGRALQLRVEAMLVGAEGYPDLPKKNHWMIEDLSYWQISGKRGEAGKVNSVMPDDEDVITASREGITALLEEFADSKNGYRSEPLESEANPYSDYEHLSRVKEWQKNIGHILESSPNTQSIENTATIKTTKEPPTKATIIADATKRQQRAADSAKSICVSANAGTGKTRVLTTRILRILVNGARISEIMAVTYTGAAAAEMRNRIYEKLADWAIISETELTQSIIELGIGTPSQKQIATARSLFARVLDASSTIRIETIHAFCQSVLRRFPFEAGIQPYFELATELQTRALQKEAISDAMSDPEAEFALNRLAQSISEENLHSLIESLLGYDDVMTHFQRDPLSVKRDIFKMLNCPDATDRPEDEIAEKLLTKIITPPNEEDLKFFAEKCFEGTETEAKRGEQLSAWLANDPTIREQTADVYISIFLTTEMKPRKKGPTKNLAETYPGLEDIFANEASRLFALKQKMKAIETANLTFALYRIANRIIESFSKRKVDKGLMDYDDLIKNTTKLLEQDGGVSWVRYKLDQGITHLLVDEAQDTSPNQWQILEKLAEEFFTGDEDKNRSLFLVGDYKQSIYSFQGARPELLTAQRDKFETMAKNANKAFENIELDTSFRTVAPILELVDQTIKPDGVPLPGIGESENHRASRIGEAGFIEILDPIISKKDTETVPYQPHRSDEIDGPDVILARKITAKLNDWIGKKIIQSKGRVMQAGDVMILLRRRNKFATILDRELRHSGLPVAGADRVRLIEEIAVIDLITLGQVMLLPQDDLSLASVLKSPLFDLNEDDLYRLAYGRGNKKLIEQLEELAASEDKFTDVHERLTEWLRLAEFSLPSQFFKTVLAPEITASFVKRLGVSVLDTLSEFLSMVRGLEDVSTPSMQKFIVDLEDSEMDIKRESATSDSDEIRIITMHGAKGLEAPIVVLPDLMDKNYIPPGLVELEFESNRFPIIASGGSERIEEAKEEAKNIWLEEEDRLLYVAMTRAEDGLLMAGFATSESKRDGSFYQKIRSALEANPKTVQTQEGVLLESQQTTPVPPPPLPPSPEVELTRPSWITEAPPREATPPSPLSPSSTMPHSPAGRVRQKAMLRGSVTHRLLEILPALDSEARDKTAKRIITPLVASGKLTQSEADSALSETLNLINHHEPAELFGANSRAEVPISGRIGQHIVNGIIDRLIIEPTQITIIDFKTGQSPNRGESISPDYITQQAIYRHVLRQIWPDRLIRAGLIYTEDASLHWLEDEEMEEKLTSLLDL